MSETTTTTITPTTTTTTTTSSSSSISSSTTTNESDTVADCIKRGYFNRHRFFHHHHHHDRNLNKYSAVVDNDPDDPDDDGSGTLLLSKSIDNLQLIDGGGSLDDNFHGVDGGDNRRLILSSMNKNHHHVHAHPRNFLNNDLHPHRGTDVLTSKNHDHHLDDDEFMASFNRLKDCTRYNSSILPEVDDDERFIDMDADYRKKFQLIRQDYFNCLNELSDENENILSELDCTRKERNYLRERIELLREEYGENLRKNREQWFNERQKYEQKILMLETYLEKIQQQQQQINDNNNPPLPTLSAHDYHRNENFKLYQLANKISELALFLSEILSNLRQSEIDLMIANYRAAGAGAGTGVNDNNNQDIIQNYERSMIKRSIIERESIDFLRNIDKQILVQYLSPIELEKLFNNSQNQNNRSNSIDQNHNNNYQSTTTTTIEFQEFQNILLNLLEKLKDDLNNVNKTLDHYHNHQEQDQLQNPDQQQDLLLLQNSQIAFPRNNFEQNIVGVGNDNPTIAYDYFPQ
uniref:Myb-like protein Z n=1 Tax=Dermatophagoides pteronyssinus TaxID=6956 RepID=A0A6P6XPU7_DERPT|nr:myb-like protein Z [Dermatophagoides pteronyssinus]